MKKPKPTEVRERILARFELTDKEMRDLGSESGRENAEINRLKEDAKAAAADYKSRVDAREAKRNTLSTKLANGYEMREVQAIVLFDPKAGKKTYVDAKDRKKVYREADMTQADWQLPMFDKATMAATRKAAAQPPASSAPAGQTNVGERVDSAIIEAATAQQKVEFDLSAALSESKPKQIIAAFKKAAIASASWPKNVAAGIAKLAEVKLTEGADAIAAFLTPFVVTN